MPEEKNKKEVEKILQELKMGVPQPDDNSGQSHK
jgi:hypothetical protein